MVAVGLTAVPIMSMTYVSDCYLPVNADALLLINGLKVCITFKETWNDSVSNRYAEHRGLRIPPRRRRLGTHRLRQRFRHTSRSVRRHHGFGHPTSRVRREDPAQDCAVENHFVMLR